MRHDRWLTAGLATALVLLPAEGRAASGVGAGAGASAEERTTSDQGTGVASPHPTLEDEQLRNGLQRLHAANAAEIELGRLGVETASNAQVRQFAQQMVDDHGRNDQQLLALAQAMNVPVTGKVYDAQQQEAQQARRTVQSRSGAAFDQAFMAQMVRDHEKNAREVGALAARARGSVPELAAFLRQTEQAMKGHLSMARQVAKAAAATARTSGEASTGAGSASGTTE
ncbi:MAG TPA: DUF4142 domain-containing protein [Anaeromyxobacter sp.]|nr:DUF4142 domain-containing protein [Anaeromyxobacter sp.]